MKLLSLLVLSAFCLEGLSKTAYVNFDQVFEKTKHGARIRTQFKKEFEKRRGLIQKREKKLQEDQMKLNKDADLISDEAKRSRLQKMQQQALELQRSLENSERELEEYKNNLILNMEKNLQPILAAMAKKNGFTKVERITKAILWVPKEADITAAVIRTYNKKHK